MIIILRDDPVVEVFDSPLCPPDWIETIDIENCEYQFCSDTGQRYVGKITKPAGFIRQAEWRLHPEGEPDIKNALALIDAAQEIEPNARFPDIESLRRHTTTNCTLSAGAAEA
jgi:hypothetical protein